ncbi:MAG: hypothetical protein IPG53_10365 [Ignavibacteriales bacterium]|nr:hypothetical protein [Ignavibacteriales bacterium]
MLIHFSTYSQEVVHSSHIMTLIGIKDLLSKHFIPGIYTIAKQTTNTTLRRVTSGNIGWRYPIAFERAGQYYLGWNSDPSTKADLIEASTERVTTLSRKIQNGYYIVTGMWPFNDDGAFRSWFIRLLWG